MTIEAPLSRYKKQNLLIFIVVLLGLAGWFYYDGHYNTAFIEKHTVNGQPDSTLSFNKKAPPFMAALAIAIAVYFVAVRNKKVVADESSLVAEGKTVAFSAIEKINKTHFDTKGYVVITYKDAQGKSCELKLSDRTYDNLLTLLDHVIAKIS
jgi:hypothetical protein